MESKTSSAERYDGIERQRLKVACKRLLNTPDGEALRLELSRQFGRMSFAGLSPQELCYAAAQYDVLAYLDELATGTEPVALEIEA